jgi:hypothetical protein
MALMPMAPNFTNRITERLCKFGLVKPVRLLYDGSRIAPEGLVVLHWTAS